MTKYKIVYVKWIDHLTLEVGNIKLESISKVKLVEEETVGFLVEDAEDCVKLAYTIENFLDGVEFTDVLVIAKKMIVEIKYLNEGK